MVGCTHDNGPHSKISTKNHNVEGLTGCLCHN